MERRTNRKVRAQPVVYQFNPFQPAIEVGTWINKARRDTLKTIGMLTVLGLTMLASVAAAQTAASATTNEAHIATQLSQQIGLLELCGMKGTLEAIPANLDQFERTHRGQGGLLANDMPMLIALNNAAFVSKAGGKEKLCGALTQFKAKAIGGVQQGWVNLQKAHAEAKTAGH
jgi:hypothetical protein